MTFSFGAAALVFLVQLLAYTVKGLIGFGNPLISAPLLSMRLDNVVITPGTLLVDAPINAYITWQNRRAFNWRQVMPLLLAMMAGIVPGTLLLRFSMPWVLKTILGVVVVGLGAEMATRSLRPASGKAPGFAVQLAVSFFSGVTGGLFGISMFIVAYLERTSKNYDELKGSMCFIFFGENLFRMSVYLVSGLITRDVLLFSLFSLPAAAVSMVLSRLLAKRLEEKKIRTAAIALFILGGASIIFKSVVFHT